MWAWLGFRDRQAVLDHVRLSRIAAAHEADEMGWEWVREGCDFCWLIAQLRARLPREVKP